jgi:hypothetical protein
MGVCVCVCEKIWDCENLRGAGGLDGLSDLSFADSQSCGWMVVGRHNGQRRREQRTRHATHTIRPWLKSPAIGSHTLHRAGSSAIAIEVVATVCHV